MNYVINPGRCAGRFAAQPCWRGGYTPVDCLRALARTGTLAETATRAAARQRTALTAAAYELAWPVVFERLTRRLELSRGHHRCAASVRRMTDQCLDRFHDDVESVIEDLLAHASRPISNLEGWLASRLNAATVDGYRRRRGQRGALQRPRLPNWLSQALDGDAWLVALATELLEWVGIGATAGSGLWPLEGWAHRRAVVTGDWPGSDAATVAREVETVLAAMRRRPLWYERYVETPLGHKEAPVVTVPAGDGVRELPALTLSEPYAGEDARLREWAATVVADFGALVAAGAEPATTVVRLLSAGQDSGPEELSLACPPHQPDGQEERLPVLLADPAVRRRAAEALLGIIAEREQPRRRPVVPRQRRDRSRPRQPASGVPQPRSGRSIPSAAA